MCNASWKEVSLLDGPFCRTIHSYTITSVDAVYWDVSFYCSADCSSKLLRTTAVYLKHDVCKLHGPVPDSPIGLKGRRAGVPLFMSPTVVKDRIPILQCSSSTWISCHIVHHHDLLYVLSLLRIGGWMRVFLFLQMETISLNGKTLRTEAIIKDDGPLRGVTWWTRTCVSATLRQ